MSRRALWLVIGLAIAIGSVSVVALVSGLDEVRLDTSGPRRDLPIEGLERERGYLQTYGCVRHDLAVGVTDAGRVYRLGEKLPPDEELTRVFTPLTAATDCDEGHVRRVYALVEDDDSLGTTITHSYRVDVPPPPVPALVSGVVGYGAGHTRLAHAARALLAKSGLDLGAGTPLFVKGKRPGVLWVAVTTTLVGVHGLFFCALGLWWARKRWRRHKASLVDEGLVESDFFGA